MKIYTKTGDDGTTGTLGLGRRSKADLIIHALGDFDELNAALGVASIDSNYNFEAVQSKLFDLGAELASLSQDERYQVAELDGAVIQLEREIDEMENNLMPLTNFVLPGGNRAGAYLHLARAICRRAERTLVELSAEENTLRNEVVKYINRLSDWLFVQARHQNQLDGVGDTIWRKQ